MNKPAAKRSHRKPPTAKPEGDRSTRVRRVGSIINQLMSRRGYAQVQAGEQIQQALIRYLGVSLAADCSVGRLRAGTLQVFVTDSVTLQELNFRKRGILKELKKDLPEGKITDVRFRIQSP